MATQIQRWMYSCPLSLIGRETPESILGHLLKNSPGDVELNQRHAWLTEIAVLRDLAADITITDSAQVYFEVTVPRMGRRADVVLLADSMLFVIEFKVGESAFAGHAVNQVWDYCLDFKYFHDASHNISIVPMLIATEAADHGYRLQQSSQADGLYQPVCVSQRQLPTAIKDALCNGKRVPISREAWEQGRYLPTPTIVEAARALYAGHSVTEISRHEAGAKNLRETTQALGQIIQSAKRDGKKCICFVTGVPGAGKTLVGLNVATENLDPASESYSVFLSGNGPLVEVLREALTRDQVQIAAQAGRKVRKGDARKKVESFIQNVHHFRDECLKDQAPPPEHVVLFDEAQRAWNMEQTSAFMARKKNLLGFQMSEPEFLISCLDRHTDWAVIVCLVGHGQEINTGEAGIEEWLDALDRRFQTWSVHVSPALWRGEIQASTPPSLLSRPQTTHNDALHLGTSMRSFRAESLSVFVKNVLEFEVNEARLAFQAIQDKYPLRITRNLPTAKAWLKQQARGSERYGVVVSSQAERLKPHAIDVRIKTDPVKWFLDGPDDVRSSYYMEEVATEFQVQGLELDWACVVWDGDLRVTSNGWSHHQFRGSRWNKIHKVDRQRYLENAYRVLLTRARQGMVLVVPAGDPEDPTRAAAYYDPTFEYLRSLGIPELS
jgi:DUF2075 family protein